MTGDAKYPKITPDLAGYHNPVVTDTAQTAGKVHDDNLGYDVPQSVLVNNAGTFGASNSSIITVTYTADTQTASVVFKDQFGHDVLGKTATTVSGYSNTALASKITSDMTKAPEGYTFVSVSGAETTPGSHTYNAVDTNFDNDKSVDQTVTVVFKAIQQTARVHYVDENGKEINGLPIATLTGTTGSLYSEAPLYKTNVYDYVSGEAAKKVPGYTLQKDQMKDGTGEDAQLITDKSVFKGSSNDLYILYTADPATLIVRYYVLDSENPDNSYLLTDRKADFMKPITGAVNEEVDDPSTGSSFTGKTDQEVTLTTSGPSFAGYTLASAYTNLSGLAETDGKYALRPGTNYIMYYFTPNDQTATINYVEKDNWDNVIDKPTTQTGASNSHINVDHKVPGWTAVDVVVDNQTIDGTDAYFDSNTWTGATDDHQQTVHVEYTPDFQQQGITIGDSTDVIITQTSRTGTDFKQVDLTAYEKPGYTMYVDNVKQSVLDTESTDTTDNAYRPLLDDKGNQIYQTGADGKPLHDVLGNEIPASETGTVDSKIQMHHITYVANPATVTVNYYLNGTTKSLKTSVSNNQLKTDDILSGTILDAITNTAIPGYTLVEGDALAGNVNKTGDGKYSTIAGNHTVTFYYKADLQTAKVTFNVTNHKDGAGEIGSDAPDEVTGETGTAIKDGTNFAKVINYKKAGYTFESVEINGVTYLSQADALNAVQNFDGTTNSIKMNYTADAQKLVIKFKNNLYTTDAKHSLIGTYDVESALQPDIIVTGTTNEKIDLTSFIGDYLSNKLPDNLAKKYGLDSGVTQPSLSFTFGAVTETRNIYLTGQAVKYSFIMLPTDYTNVFDANGKFVGVQDPANANGVDNTYKTEVNPVGFGNVRSALITSYDNFVQNKVVVAYSLAGGVDPWGTVMTIHGKISGITNGVATIVADPDQSSNILLKVPDQNGNITPFEYKGLSSFKYTLQGDNLNKVDGDTIDIKGIGWDLFARGYITGSAALFVSEEMFNQQVAAGAHDAGPWTYVRTTLPAIVSPNDQTNLIGTGGYSRDIAGAIKAGKETDAPVFAIYYYLTDAIQTANVHFYTFDADGNKVSLKDDVALTAALDNNGKPLAANAGNSDKKIDYSKIDLDIPGYEIISDGTKSVTSYNDIGVLPQVDANNMVKYGTDGKALQTADTHPDEVNVIYKALPQEASVSFKLEDANGVVSRDDDGSEKVVKTINLPEGVTNGKIDAASFKAFVDASYPGYHVDWAKSSKISKAFENGFVYSGTSSANQLSLYFAPDEQEAVINFNLQNKPEATDSFNTAHPSIKLIGTTNQVVDKDNVFVQAKDDAGKPIANTYKLVDKSDADTEGGQKYSLQDLMNGQDGSFTGYTQVSNPLSTFTFKFDGNDNHTPDNKTVADNDAMPQTFNLGYTANATQVKVVYRVQQMGISYDADGKAQTYQLKDEHGNPLYRIITPSGDKVHTSETGTYGDSYTVDVANESLLNQGYEFDSVEYQSTSTNGQEVKVGTETQNGADAGTANSITYKYFPDTYYADAANPASPKGTTVTKSIVNQLTFSENDYEDNNATVYVTYKPILYNFDIVYVVRNSDGSAQNSGVLIHEAGIAGTFYSYDTPVLPQPEYIMDHADQANLNGPYGPQVNGFGLGVSADGNQYVTVDDGTGRTQAHLIVTYTAQDMSVTANYVLVDANGNPVTDANGNKVFLANNAVSLGEIGKDVNSATFYQVEKDGSKTETPLTQEQVVPDIPGYVIRDKNGVWQSEPLRYGDLDLADESGKLMEITPIRNEDDSYKLITTHTTDTNGNEQTVVSIAVKTGDGKLDIVAQTADQYKDYVENVYNQYVAKYNEFVDYYNSKQTDATKKLTEKTPWFAGLDIKEQITKIWGQSNLEVVDPNNAKHLYQPAQNYVTYQYRLDPTITYTYKSDKTEWAVSADKKTDTNGRKLLMKNADGAFVEYDGTAGATLYYDTTDHKVALQHVDPTYADVDATTGVSKGAGAYMVKDDQPDVVGYSRSDKQGTIFDGNAAVTNGELPNTNFNVTFTAQTQQVNVKYELAEADQTNPAAVAKVADMHGHTLAVATDTSYEVDKDGTLDAFKSVVDTIPAGYVVGTITVNGLKVASYDNATNKFMNADGTAEFETIKPVAVANDGDTVNNNVVYTLQALPQNLNVSYGYTENTISGWTAPAALKDADGKVVTDVVNDTTYVTDQNYPVNIPDIKGYTATIQQLSTDGKKVLNSWSATQFATLQKAGLVMADGGATYKVTYTPIPETVQVTYTKPGVSGAYLTADTVSTVVDATYNVVTVDGTKTHMGPLESQIPVGYKVASVSINGGEEIAVKDGTKLDMNIAYRVDGNGNVMANTVVYHLKPSLQNLNVNYKYADVSFGDVSALHKQVVNELKYSTGENFNLTTAGYVPTIPGYTASVKDSAGNTIDFTNDVQMSSTGLTLTVTYTPKKQTVAVNYDTTNLSDTQKDAVNKAYGTTVLVNGSITGLTDAPYNGQHSEVDKDGKSVDVDNLQSSVAGFDYRVVKAVPGYVFQIVSVVGDKENVIVENGTKDFNFKDLTSAKLSLDQATGKLAVDNYKVTYASVQQSLNVNFTYATSDGDTSRVVPANNLKDYNVTEQDANTETGDNTAKIIVDSINALLNDEKANKMQGYSYTIKVTSGGTTATYQDVNALTNAEMAADGQTVEVVFAPDPQKLVVKYNLLDNGKTSTMTVGNVPNLPTQFTDGLSDSTIDYVANGLTDDNLKVPGYTYTVQMVDKTYATLADVKPYNTIAEAAAAMSRYDHDDDFDQQIIVTYAKATNQKAVLTNVWDSNNKELAPTIINNGVTGDQVKFDGISDAQIQAKGYTSVVVQIDGGQFVDGKIVGGEETTAFANLNSLPTYTDDADDTQIFTVKRVAKAQNVPVVTENLPSNLKPTVPSLTGFTHGAYVLPDAGQLAALNVPGYHITGYKLVGANGASADIESFDAKGFANQLMDLNTNPKSDSDLKYTQFVVMYEPDTQRAKVIVNKPGKSAETFESEPGVTDGKITFDNVTDTALQVPGYSYVVTTSADRNSHFQTLADAEQAMNTFDNTANGLSKNDSDEQTYTVTYTPLDQSINIVAEGLPAAKTWPTKALTGVTDAQYAGVPTDEALHVDGYDYVIYPEGNHTKTVSLTDLTNGHFAMDAATGKLAVSGYDVVYTAKKATAQINYVFDGDGTANAVAKPTDATRALKPADGTIEGQTDGTYPTTEIKQIPGYTAVVTWNGTATGSYVGKKWSGTFTAADNAGTNSIYTVTYTPTLQNVKINYSVDKTYTADSFTVPSQPVTQIPTDYGYQVTSISTPGYKIESVEGKAVSTALPLSDDRNYYVLDDNTLISLDLKNVTFTGAATVDRLNDQNEIDYGIVLVPTEQQADIIYHFANSNPNKAAVAKVAGVADANDATTFTKNEPVYTDHDYNFTVLSIDGYNVNVVENVTSKAIVTEKPTKLSANQTVVDNGDSTYTILTTTSDVKGAYTLNDTTLSAVMHAADASYVVTYTPKDKTVKVTYDVSKLSDVEKAQVNAPADGEINGATDMAYSDKGFVSADKTVDYTKIAHKEGYTYALMANNKVVNDDNGNPITGMTTDFDLNDFPGTMTVKDELLTVPVFTVVYTPVEQTQLVTIDYADVPAFNENSVSLTDTRNSSDTFDQVELKSYVKDGYDMLVDGKPVNLDENNEPIIPAEQADFNDLTDGKDATPQTHKVTFKAKAVQKATLQFKNYPASAGTKKPVVIDDGVSDADIQFNVTADDLAVPGYSYVITRLSDDGKVELDSEGHVIDEQTTNPKNPIKATFTRDTSDNQIYEVKYTALPQQVTVNVVDDDNGGQPINLDDAKAADKAWDSDTDAQLTYTTDQANALLKQLDKGTDLTVATIVGADVATKVGSNVITVHVKHATAPITQTVTMAPTAVYGQNGLATDGQSVADVAPQTVTLKGTEDLYTGRVIAWENPDVTLTVDAPDMPGYKASLTTPDGASLDDNGALTFTKSFPVSVDFETLDTTFNPVVTYTAEPKSATVKFVDETDGGRAIPDMTDNKMTLPDGVTDRKINFKSVTDMIADLVSKGYVVDKANTTLPTTDTTFNADSTKNNFTVSLKHGIEQLKAAEETVTGTITYSGAKQNPDSVTQTGKVQRHFSADAVTHTEIPADKKGLYADPSEFQESKYQVVDGDIASVDAAGTVVTFEPAETPVYDAATKAHEELKGYALNTPTVTMTASVDKAGSFESIYTPVPQDALVNFVDVTDGNKTIASLNLWGVTGGGDIKWEGTEKQTDKPAVGSNVTIPADQRKTVADIVDELEAKGYLVVLNPVDADGHAKDASGETIQWDNDDTVPQSVTVTLKHKVTKKTETKPVTETVSYTGYTGSDAATKAKLDDVVKHATVTRTYYVDNVNNEEEVTASTKGLTLGDYGDDAKAPVFTLDSDDPTASVDPRTGTVTFTTVTSPEVPGYDVDKDAVTTTVKYGENPTAVTVTYTPQVAKAHITYIDDATGKEIQVDTINGHTDDDIVNGHADGTDKTYSVDDALAELNKSYNNGLEYVSDNFAKSKDTFDNQTDTDTVVSQDYVVHVKHKTERVSTPETTTNNVKIVTKIGDTETTEPGTKVTGTIERTYTKDVVTGTEIPSENIGNSIYYTTSDAPTYKVTDGDGVHVDQTGKVTFDVPSDDKPGYTKTVQNDGATYDNPNGETTITYTANPAKATVTLIDDVTKNVLGTVTLTGVTDQVVNFADADKAVQDQEKVGYHVVNNQYDDAKKSGVKFDVNADTHGATQQWTVHFNHKTTKQESTTPVKKTTTFVVDGTTKTPSSITPAPITQTGEVTKHYPGDATKTGDDAKTPVDPSDTTNFTNETGDGVPDKVTYTSDNTTPEGTPGLTGVTPEGNPIFGDVTPPDVPGYTPSDPVTDDNGNQVVTYKPNTQTANIVYKDKLTDAVLHTDTPSGLTDHDIVYSTADEITALKEQGYSLVSDGFIPGTTYNPSDNTYYVILNRAVTPGTETKTVTKKITYVVDGGDPSKAPKTVNQTVTVDRKFAVDKHTGQEIPDGDVTSDNYDGGFPDSYTTGDSNDGNVNETTGDVTFNDVTTPADPGSFGHDDVTEVVTYTPNDQEVKVHYDNTNLTPNQQHSVPGGDSDFTMTGKTDTPYDTATVNGGPTTVPAVPGYTFTVTSNGKTVFTSDDDNPTYDFKTVTDGHNFTVTENGLTDGDYTITYTTKTVTGQVVVIDDATGKPVQTDELTGKTDANVDYDSAATIKNFTDKGYVLVSNDLSDAKTYNFDAAKNVFEIHLKHDTMDGTGTPTTVVRHTTIQTPDGKTVTVEQIVEVTPHYSVDKVTGERVPDDQLGDDTKYANTETPWFESHDKTSTDITGMTGFDEKTGTPTFGEVAVPNIPGYKMVRTNEPNGDQVVTFVPDGSAVVETSNNVQPVATVATPQTTIATPSRMTPMNNVVAGTPAPTTNTVDGELPVFVETVDNTPVVNKDNLWIYEIPDDKDGDIANLNSLNDMSWRTSDPYLVAMLIAALAAAGMFGVLLAFYRRREAVERKLAERRED
ncbi:hypothetical protein FM131_01900 [Weissella confusa]|uniref:mucin-binding protein n=1 Tax=Weissella confusa TaxID=1583 RepID=UPI000989A192|nr:hypothetical protein [Weissella confusa]SJX67713.1 hypothetical protein FM131_01900 [Weissella confusa]